MTSNRQLKRLCVLKDVIRHILDEYGQPITKLHGLRMLNQQIFTKLPLSSADSTNVARNIGLDSNWKGTYQPHSKETRTSVLVERIEAYNSLGSLRYDEKLDHFSIQLGLEV